MIYFFKDVRDMLSAGGDLKNTDDDQLFHTNIFLDQVGSHCHHHMTLSDPGPVRAAGPLLALQQLPVSPRLGVSRVQEHAGPHN